MAYLRVELLEAMHQANGVDAGGRSCGDCAHCVSESRTHSARGTVSFRVCRKAPLSPRKYDHLPAKRFRWLRAWPACGLFQAGE